MLDSTQIWLQRLAWLLSLFIYFYSTSNPRVTSTVGCLVYGLMAFLGMSTILCFLPQRYLWGGKGKIKNSERTRKEKLGLSQVSFHIRVLLNSDCSLCRLQTSDYCNSVWNCPVIYPLEPRSSFSLHFKLSSGRPWRFFPLSTWNKLNI